ncbi:MAG: type I-C CRISPR-associated protein Cas8c/Csd1 [Oscillospiraceae bacterium]|nr:type I-C CRISPR-associated protein Cas8c/Csd1 [Oscillospiraceae bacterium]
MSIWQKAYETYDNHAHLAGVYFEGKEPLSPICHMVVNAQIEITLRVDGTFCEASALTKESGKTIIPVTEESADRGGTKPNAHPLSDQLQYLSNVVKDKYENYVAILSAWADSEYSTPKIEAVRKYILGGTILDDLKSCRLIAFDNNASFVDSKYAKYVVRWRVYDSGDTDECWRDFATFDAWKSYYLDLLSGQRNECFCMISGKQDIATSRHPRAIVQGNYGAKLISQKDTERVLAYKGRFLEAEQAAAVGFTSSQETHCALRWLAANEGVVEGGCTIICWNPNGKPVFKPTDDLFDDDDDVGTPVEPSEYKQLLSDTIQGYKNELPDDEDVCILTLDAATTGRLSITYYSEKTASDYYKRIEDWYRSICFIRRTKGSMYSLRSPRLGSIVRCAFGTERNGNLEVDDKLLRMQMKRLLPCITESAPISLEIVRSLKIKASQPQNYRDYNNLKGNYQFVLYTACAVIRKYHNDLLNKEEWTMQLDTAKTDRSYLFGRLLAVMEYTERSTYERDERREPNAVRMFTAFCERPMNMTAVLKKRLMPYLEKLKPWKRRYVEDLMGDIIATFREEDEAALNRPLEDTYLLGYYLQRKELYKPKEEKESEITESEED